MDINTLVKLTNQKLAGETLLYSQLEPYFDDVIDKINTELNAIFPTFSEHRERNQTDSGIPAYTYFPDMYIRSVVVVGAAVGFYTVDEEGILTAQQMQVEYNTNLFMMKRDYSEQVPEKYKATGRGYLTGGNFYVNTDCKQCMSANNGHCPKTCGIMDLYPDLRYVPIQGPPGPAGASVIAVSDIEPTDKACKIWIKAYEDYAEVYTRNDTGSFVYLTKILSSTDVDKLQNAVSFDGTITTAEVSSEQCHTNRGIFKILTSSGYSQGGILMAFGPFFNSSTATRQLAIMPTNNGKSMIKFRKYTNGMWQPWEDVIDTASYAKTSDLDTHINDTNNPHKLTKAALGLGNVDNTADADKAVLSATKLFNTRKINGVDFNGTKDITVADDTKIPLTQKGIPNGVATLGSDGLVPAVQLPSYVDDIIEGYLYNDKFYEDVDHTIEVIGINGKIYMDVDTSLLYRWSGSKFAEVSKSLALGETPYTAYPGNKGKQNAEAIETLKSKVSTAENDITNLQDNKAEKTDVAEALATKANLVDGIVPVDELPANLMFDGTITTSLLSDKVNCPRTIGVFKALKSDGNTYGILISTAVGTETDARFQLYILPSSIGTMQIRWRKYDTTANEWSDWDIQRPRLITTDPIATPVSLNSIYAINQTGTSAAVIVRLPEGKVGDFVQYDFVTGSTAPTVTIESMYGMTEFDFTPEANKIYSLFFDWGIIGNDGTNRYGWRISYAEYERVQIFPEEDL